MRQALAEPFEIDGNTIRITGSFGLTNHQPGPLDRQQLPLNTLAGTLAWQGSTASFANLHASLPGNGEAPAAPVFIDGEKAMTLRGDNIAREFHQIVETYIEKRFG